MTTSNPGPLATITSNPTSVLGLSSGLQLLFHLKNANMRLTTDQVFERIFNGKSWDPFFITAVWKGGAYNTACLGGIFTLPSKSGNAIVAVGQSYAGLTGADTHVNCSIQASTTTFYNTPILSLSTANAIDLSASFFIYGVSYDALS